MDFYLIDSVAGMVIWNICQYFCHNVLRLCLQGRMRRSWK